MTQKLVLAALVLLLFVVVYLLVRKKPGPTVVVSKSPGAAAGSNAAGSNAAGSDGWSPFSRSADTATLIQAARDSTSQLMTALNALLGTLGRCVADATTLQTTLGLMGVKVEPQADLPDAVGRATTKINFVIENYNAPCGVSPLNCGYAAQLAVLTPSTSFDLILMVAGGASAASALVIVVQSSIQSVIDSLNSAVSAAKTKLSKHLTLDMTKYGQDDLDRYFKICPQGRATSADYILFSETCSTDFWKLAPIPLGPKGKAAFTALNDDINALSAALPALVTLATRVRYSGAALQQSALPLGSA